MQNKTLVHSIIKSAKSFSKVIPMLVGVILLMGLFQTFITQEMIVSIFSGNPFVDTLLGTITGGVSVGTPVVSYVISGELLSSGVSLYAVTAFILSWVSLGVVQLPLEFELFGKKFTILRNLFSFIAAIVVTLLTVMTLELFQ